MPDPLELRSEHEPALDLVLAEAKEFLATLDESLVRDRRADEIADAIGGDLPERARARAFVTWATLRAYGRSGYRAMVERHNACFRPAWSSTG